MWEDILRIAQSLLLFLQRHFVQMGGGGGW